MLKYCLKRLLIVIPTFLWITIMVYVLASLAPGSPVEMLFANAGGALSAEAFAQMEAQLGLDQPVIIQYFHWLGGILQGNLGTSYRTMQPVASMLAERIGPTLLLSVTALVMALLAAVPLGIAAACKPYSVWDYVSSGLSFLGAAMPNFFAAMILIYVFCIKLNILPTGGMWDSGGVHTVGVLACHLLLPAITLMIQYLGAFTRQTRSSMLEVLNEDFVRTARAKGLMEDKVVLRHALRNALIPLVTQIGLSLPVLIGGAVVTEQIFGWPGMGSLMVTSINFRDYPVIMGITVLIALFVLVGNIVIDLIYGLLDPRIVRT